MTTLLLVRHGSTEWNASGRLQGATDIALSAQGEREVRSLRPLVEAWSPSAAVCSPLQRAAATAQLLTGEAVTADPRLVEVGLGAWEGRTAAEIGDDVRSWRRGELVPPRGEAADAASARILAALRDAAALGGTVLVVTHGGVVRAALGGLVGLATRHIAPVPPASLTVIDLAGDEPRLRALGITPQQQAPASHLQA
ncbi:histidine phosphatase family protein [Agrococcus sp. Marseille-P2731]|uniref:histidine phosphatase family protein n=1 Tax=Agrococcus sp. Marseille-P2731 TaxID=1841862 RepID=UPI0009306E8D|nr:histidine phosphatase family protein [Agrococcus sp. Marseille-P2731]